MEMIFYVTAGHDDPIRRAHTFFLMAYIVSSLPQGVLTASHPMAYIISSCLEVWYKHRPFLGNCPGADRI